MREKSTEPAPASSRSRSARLTERPRGGKGTVRPEAAEGLHHLVATPPEEVVEADVLPVELVVDGAAPLERSVGTVLQVGHPPRGIHDRVVAAGGGAGRHRTEHGRAQG